MYCIFCHRISDPHPSHTCPECRRDLANYNRHALLMYLLARAYEHVKDIKLREQIEMNIFVFTG